MSDQPSNNPSAPPKTPGELLKAARLHHGFQQSAVADRMRLSVQTIIDLENDDYARFSAEIYLRGHIRTYSRIVHLDEDKVLQCYEAMGFVFEADNRDRMLSSQTAPITTRTRRSKKRALLWVSFSVMLVLVVMVVMWWREQQSPVYNTLTNKTNMSTRIQTIPIAKTPSKPSVQVMKKATHPKRQKRRTHHIATALKKSVHASANSESMKDFVPDYKIVPVHQ